jgi:hypothetical protein
MHICALPHTHTTTPYLSCAYTAKVINFCRMMMDRGHEVFLYAGEQNEALCAEHIPCTTEKRRADHVGSEHFTSASFDYNLPFWRDFNDNVIAGIKKNRLSNRDFVCVIGGYAHKQIADALPDMITVEFGVGYPCTFS